MSVPPRILYYSPSTKGGLADYAKAQANALVNLGVEVDLLSSPEFPIESGDLFHLRPELLPKKTGGGVISRKVEGLRSILANYEQLRTVIREHDYGHVLMGSYAEHFSPLWSGPLRRLKQQGVVFGSVVHDPVRDFALGPRWWHRKSIADAYSFIREAFVHENIALDTVRPMPDMHTTAIPHGPMVFPRATKTREAVRQQLGIPLSAQVWLSFGHVRDGKNLQLVIEALAQFPDAVLLVVGKEQSAGQRPVSFYQELASKMGVGDRCFWVNRFVAAEEVGDFFEASDLTLLTYSKDFRSASGVLNVATFFRKPCVASSGQGNLRSVVSDYGMGVWVEPDRLPDLVYGLHKWRATAPTPRWEDYERENSWQRNASIVAGRMFDLPSH
jgi:glycosyltransferase involved in cell wall biosynthesis